MSLGIGINENLVVKEMGVKTSEKKGTQYRAITFEEYSPSAGAAQAMDIFCTGEPVKKETLMLFPTKIFTNTFDGGVKSAEEIKNEIASARRQLTDLLSVHMTETEINKYISTNAVKIIEGVCTIADFNNPAKLPAILSNVDNVHKICDNMFDLVAAKMQTFVGKNPFRMKVVRSSKKKNDPKLPSYYYGGETWVESMTVDKSISKVAFSAKELERGADSALAYDSDQEDPNAVAAAAAQFGTGMPQMPGMPQAAAPQMPQMPQAPAAQPQAAPQMPQATTPQPVEAQPVQGTEETKPF